MVNRIAYNRDDFAAIQAESPELHPATAIMRALGTRPSARDAKIRYLKSSISMWEDIANMATPAPGVIERLAMLRDDLRFLEGEAE